MASLNFKEASELSRKLEQSPVRQEKALGGWRLNPSFSLDLMRVEGLIMKGF